MVPQPYSPELFQLYPVRPEFGKPVNCLCKDKLAGFPDSFIGTCLAMLAIFFKIRSPTSKVWLSRNLKFAKKLKVGANWLQFATERNEFAIRTLSRSDQLNLR